jgi:hypothetical protein
MRLVRQTVVRAHVKKQARAYAEWTTSKVTRLVEFSPLHEAILHCVAIIENYLRSPNYWPTFSPKKLSVNVDKECVGLHYWLHFSQNPLVTLRVSVIYLP